MRLPIFFRISPTKNIWIVSMDIDAGTDWDKVPDGSLLPFRRPRGSSSDTQQKTGHFNQCHHAPDNCREIHRQAPCFLGYCSNRNKQNSQRKSIVVATSRARVSLTTNLCKYQISKEFLEFQTARNSKTWRLAINKCTA